MAKRMTDEEMKAAVDANRAEAVAENKAGEVAVKAKKVVDPAVKERKDRIKHLYGRVKYMLYMDSQLIEKHLTTPGWALSSGDIQVGRAAGAADISFTNGGSPAQAMDAGDLATVFATLINE